MKVGAPIESQTLSYALANPGFEQGINDLICELAAKTEARLPITARPGRWVVKTGTHNDPIDLVNTVSNGNGVTENVLSLISNPMFRLDDQVREYHFLDTTVEELARKATTTEELFVCLRRCGFTLPPFESVLGLRKVFPQPINIQLTVLTEPVSDVVGRRYLPQLSSAYDGSPIVEACCIDRRRWRAGDLLLIARDSVSILS